MIALLALLVLSQSPNTDAELFVDRGETYIRAGTANGLEVGSPGLISSVPEPTGWALALAGLLAGGSVSLRLRRDERDPS